MLARRCKLETTHQWKQPVTLPRAVRAALALMRNELFRL